MTKVIGIAELKAKCERLISQMERDGEPIELTRRGKTVGVLSPPILSRPDPDSLFGCLEGTGSWVSDDELMRPVWDEPWDAELGRWEPEA